MKKCSSKAETVYCVPNNQKCPIYSFFIGSAKPNSDYDDLDTIKITTT